MTTSLEYKKQLRVEMEAESKEEESKYSDNDESLSLVPLTPEQTSTKGITEPPPWEYVFKDLIPKGIVGGIIAAGGSGKSFLLLQMACALSAGKDFGIFQPVRPNKVLYIAGEDSEIEVRRRAYNVIKHLGLSYSDTRANNLHIASVVGQIGPLMMLSANNPVFSPSYQWLQKTIEAHAGLDVLIIDPKSRFYGLDENSNDHATQWIAALERLTQDYSLTVLFAHHESKQRSGDMSQHSSRGASAIVDGCRWVAGIRRMDEKKAEKLCVSNPNEYIELDVTKSNYSPFLSRSVFFKRSESGCLEPADLELDKLKSLAFLLRTLLGKSDKNFSKRELCGKEKSTNKLKEIIAAIKEDYPKFAQQKEMLPVIDYGLKNKFWTEQEEGSEGGKKNKKVLILSSVMAGNL